MHRATSFRPVSPSIQARTGGGFGNPFDDGLGEFTPSDEDSETDNFTVLAADSPKKSFTMRNVFLTLSARLDRIEGSLREEAPEDRRAQRKLITTELTKMYYYTKRMGDALAQISKGKRYDHDFQRATWVELESEDEGDLHVPRPYEERGGTCGCFG